MRHQEEFGDQIGLVREPGSEASLRQAEASAAAARVVRTLVYFFAALILGCMVGWCRACEGLESSKSIIDDFCPTHPPLIR